MSTRVFNPLFVVIEGLEGVGKSSVLVAVADRLSAISGLGCVGTREPGGSPLAEEIRTIFKCETMAGSSPLTQAHLIAAARSDHIDRTIAPALARDKNVVCDRFALSTMVYQGTFPFMAEVVRRLTPDLTIVLTASPENVAKRLAKRSGNQPSDWLDRLVSSKHSEMQDRMLSIVANDKCFRVSRNYLVVDTNKYDSIDEVKLAIEHEWELENYFKNAHETLCYI